MSMAIIHIDRQEEAERVAALLGADVISYSDEAFREAFLAGNDIVALMACGIVVRRLAPLIVDKWTDPAVVVMSPGLRFAIPLLGGHHGANELAERLSGLGALPIVTTATEARGLEAVEVTAERQGLEVLNRESTRQTNAAILRSEIPLYALTGPAVAVAGPGVSVLVRHGEYVVGLGCNRGTSADEIFAAVRNVLAEAGVSQDEVLAYATTVRKMDETGLREGVALLGGNLVYVDDQDINGQDVEESAARLIGLRAVAEPAALFVSRRKELITRRKAIGNVTVAIAR